MEDRALALDWIKAHGKVPPHCSWLPEVGGVVTSDGEPVAMGWLYTDRSVGVGHLDWLCTRPGLSPGEARRFISALLGGLEAIATSLFPGAYVMVGCVQSPAMAKLAEGEGFEPLGSTNLIVKAGGTHS